MKDKSEVFNKPIMSVNETEAQTPDNGSCKQSAPSRPKPKQQKQRQSFTTMVPNPRFRQQPPKPEKSSTPLKNKLSQLLEAHQKDDFVVHDDEELENEYT